MREPLPCNGRISLHLRFYLMKRPQQVMNLSQFSIAITGATAFS
jgi:hypothetical protein